LEGTADAAARIGDWFEMRMSLSMQAHPLSKRCPTPDCRGFLIAATDAAPATADEGVEEKPLKIGCTTCHVPYCWRCTAQYHPGRSCSEMKAIAAKWSGLLRLLAGDAAGSSEGDREAAAKALQKIDQLAAGKQYHVRVAAHYTHIPPISSTAIRQRLFSKQR